MNVRAKFTFFGLSLHRGDDFAVDDEAANVSAARFFNVFLNEYLDLEAEKRFDHALCSLAGFGEHHTYALSTL